MPTAVDDGYRLLAAQCIHKQTKRLAAQLDGVRRGENVEFVHDARVASRRLRAVFRVFSCCCPSGDLKRWQKHVRRVTSGLGKARDRDVQIEFLCAVLEKVDRGEHYPGIARLLVRLEKSRERLQPKVVSAIDSFEASGVLRELQNVVKTAPRQAAKWVDAVRTPFTFQETERHILGQLDELLSHEDSVGDPDAHEEHHRTRIAAKQLRYTLEIAKPVYDGRLDGAIDAAKKVQSYLGDVHDCDVWLRNLTKFADRERARVVRRFGNDIPFPRLNAGIEYLCEVRRCQRCETFQHFVDYWGHLHAQGIWEELVGTVQARDSDAIVAETKQGEFSHGGH